MKNRSRLTIFTTILSVLACFGLAFGAGGPESPDPSPFPVNSNTADGFRALENSDNAFNSAFGWFSLFTNTDAFFNTGLGAGTLFSNCIAIGAPCAGPFAVFNNTCFIGSIFGEPVSDPGSQVPVFVDQFNVVGIFNTSSRKLKHDIQPMHKASETIYQFKPVTFKY